MVAHNKTNNCRVVQTSETLYPAHVTTRSYGVSLMQLARRVASSDRITLLNADLFDIGNFENHADLLLFKFYSRERHKSLKIIINVLARVLLTFFTPSSLNAEEYLT